MDNVPELSAGWGTSPGQTLHADLVLRVGPDQLAHVEYERRPAGNLVARMHAYLGVIARRYPSDKVAQHIVVLGEGRVRQTPVALVRWFWQVVSVFFSGDVDPARLLKEIGLAPMAALGRGDRTERARAFAAAIAMIRDAGGPRMQDRWEFSVTLARITLDPAVIVEIFEEAGLAAETVHSVAMELMWEPLIYRSPVGKKVCAEMRAEGQAHGSFKVGDGRVTCIFGWFLV